MASKEESDTSFDDSEELSNDRETNKSEESVTSTRMSGNAMENAKSKIINLKATSHKPFYHVHFRTILNHKTL